MFEHLASEIRTTERCRAIARPRVGAQTKPCDGKVLVAGESLTASASIMQYRQIQVLSGCILSLMIQKWSKFFLVVSGVLTILAGFIGIGIFLEGGALCFESFHCGSLLIYLALVGPYFIAYFFYKAGKYIWSVAVSVPYVLFALGFLAFAIFIGMVV